MSFSFLCGKLVGHKSRFGAIAIRYIFKCNIQCIGRERINIIALHRFIYVDRKLANDKFAIFLFRLIIFYMLHARDRPVIVGITIGLKLRALALCQAVNFWECLDGSRK